MSLRDAIANWYLRNASIRHGHLPDEQMQVVTADAPASKKSWPAMLGAAALGSGLPILGWLASQWGKNDAPAPPVVSRPAEQGNGSLYQFLEDQDLHLPENE